jgi:hypothetical protein
MRRGLLVLLLLVCAFSFSSDAFAQRGPDPSGAPAARIASGGNYRLSPLPVWRIGGAASGGGYSLAVDPGSGCCCKSYLPCFQR